MPARLPHFLLAASGSGYPSGELYGAKFHNELVKHLIETLQISGEQMHESALLSPSDFTRSRRIHSFSTDLRTANGGTLGIGNEKPRAVFCTDFPDGNASGVTLISMFGIGHGKGKLSLRYGNDATFSSPTDWANLSTLDGWTNGPPDTFSFDSSEEPLFKTTLINSSNQPVATMPNTGYGIQVELAADTGQTSNVPLGCHVTILYSVNI